jgi:hypothetical protein
LLPPGFWAAAVPNDPFAQAGAMARADMCDPGTMLWALNQGGCRAAVVLAPDRDIAEPTLTAMGLLALYDALAVLAPPQLPIDVVCGDGLAVDGGRAAWVRSAAGPGSPPDWAVIGFEVALTAAAENPGEAPDETCLTEEGFGDVTPEALLAGFCRHLLTWIETWRDEGAHALSRAVEDRSTGRMVRA